MNKIEIFNLRILRNNEHLQFLYEFSSLVNEAHPEDLGIDDLFHEFEQLLQEEKAAMLTERGSILTEKIAATDQQRDNTWHLMYRHIKNILISPEKEEANSALVLLRIFDLYGNCKRLSYNEESAALTNLLTNLNKPENAVHLEKTGIAHWVLILQEQNTHFTDLQEMRNTELAQRGNGDVKAIRKQTDPAYRKMIEKLNALIILKQAKPATAAFADQLNQQIRYYRTTYSIRSGRRRKDKTSEPTAET